jgi:hypothetical protein
MDEAKRLQIQQCVETGDWGILGDMITRNDMMDYLLHYTNPTITDKGLEVKRLPKVQCPLCGHPVRPYSVTLTHRAVKYLMCAVFLSKEDIAKGGTGYVHHEVVHDFCQGKFTHEKGSRLGKGISFTAYGTLMSAPWDFLEPQVNTKYKPNRDGTFKPTEKCYDFLRAKVGVKVRCEFLDNHVVRTGGKLVYAPTVVNMNWQKTIELYKTF